MTKILYEVAKYTTQYTVARKINEIYGVSTNSYAFMPCREVIKTVDFQEGSQLSKISDYSFYNCTELISVDLSHCSNLLTVGAFAFAYSCSLTNLAIPSSVTSLQNRAFSSCTSLKSLKINCKFTTIPEYLCEDCISLENVELCPSTEVISSYAFYNCSSLNTTIVLPNILIINMRAFMYCSSLTTISFGNVLHTIYSAAFFECKSLREISLPSTIKEMGWNVFLGCLSLSTVTFGDNPPLTELGNELFENSGIKSIRIPKNVNSIQLSCFYNTTKLESFSVEQGSTYFEAIDGVLFNNSRKTLVEYPKALTAAYNIPAGTETLFTDSFSYASLSGVTFPSSLELIGERAFYKCNKITSLSFQGFTTNIKLSDRSFYSCESLKDVSFSKVFKIDTKCFSNCKKLETVTFSNDIGIIFDEAFESCESLTTVTLQDFLYQIGVGVFKGCTNLNSITISTRITKFTNSFLSMTGLTEYTVPSHVTELDSLCFASCKKLRRITIHSGVTFIGDAILICCSDSLEIILSPPSNFNIINTNLFVDKDVTKLIQFVDDKSTTVTLPASITTIGANSFENCSLITEIIIEGDPQLTTICANAFLNCYSLSTLSICPHLTSIEFQAFLNSGITKVNFCPGIEIISSSVFKNCTKLGEISDLVNLTSIGREAFYDCLELTTIGTLNSLTKVKRYAFRNNYKLQSELSLPKVSTVEKKAFKDCFLLKSVSFGESLELLEEECFLNCISLISISIPATIKSVEIEDSVFDNCTSLTTFSIDAETQLERIGRYAFYMTAIRTIRFTSHLRRIRSNAFKDSLIEEVYFDANCPLEEIEDKCFENCVNLHKIELPNSILIFCDLAFYNTGFTTFTVPPSVKTISPRAFGQCKELSSFIISENSMLAVIGYRIFEFCLKLEVIENHSPNFIVYEDGLFNANKSRLIVYPPGSPRTTIKMPQELKYISPYALYSSMNVVNVEFPSNSILEIDFSSFELCTSLTNINIPLSLTTIGFGAFRDCDSLKCGLLIENKADDFLDDLVLYGLMPERCIYECPKSSSENKLRRINFLLMYIIVFITF